MRSIRFVIIFFFGFCASIVHADLLPDTTIQHETVPNFTAGNRLLLEAQLNDTNGIVEARCYFKTDLDINYLYVSMDSLFGNTYQCFLPAFKTGSQTLEYFFLVVNGVGQVIRSTQYVTKEAGNNAVPQEQITVAPSSLLYVRSELGDIGKDDTSIIDDQIVLATTQNFNQLYGLRAGVYEMAAIPDSFTVMPGYFGGFIIDRIDNTIRPIKGFAPNLKETHLKSKSLTDGHQNNANIQLQSIEPPNIGGNNWLGYFTRTDTNVKEYLSASIVQAGSQVTIITTLTGLGQTLDGKINSNGDMLLYDRYDNEDWTTHYGPATSTKINIYDYIWPPQTGEPEPPLNVIVLYRSPRPPSGVQASDGLFKDEITVNWNPSSGATYYVVYACYNSSTDSCTSLSEVGIPEYVDTRKITGRIFYRITACNEYGCSQFSDYDTGHNQLISISPILHLLLKTM